MSASVTLHARGELQLKGHVFAREGRCETFALLSVNRLQAGLTGADVSLHVTDPAELERLAEEAVKLARKLRLELAAEKAADRERAGAETVVANGD